MSLDYGRYKKGERTLPDYSDYFCDLITALAHLHAHEKSKTKMFKVKKRVSNPLDWDQVDELVDVARDELGFVHREGDLVWMDQNRAMLEFLEGCTDDLWSLGCRFDHLDPPSLRDEFDLPPPSF